MKDNRDPNLLGLKILEQRKSPTCPLSQVIAHLQLHVPDYQDETTIEKYGDPRLLPSTMPN